MKNHQSHPTGSKPFPEVNGTFVQKTRKNQGYRYGKGQWKRRRDNSSKSNPPYHQKWRHNELNQGKGKNLHKPEDKCHRCGMHGHWSRTCRTPKHLTDLYQASLKQNTVETNFIHKDGSENHNACIDVNTYLDVSDFFENSDKTKNMLSGGIIRDD
ncbi:Retrovirus-related polyprotein from transposon [Salix suchowensis]|nr:Retrovirus-related polyprotein from transposon [Salix suchowensis]